MPTQVIVLNGGSSSGKSTIARCLQQLLLPEPWLAFSIDDLLAAMPASWQDSDDGIEIADDGAVSVGASFRMLEAAWLAGLAAMVRAGARVVADDVFLGQSASQERWRRALDGLDVLWVGVRCAPAVAAERAAARGDRVHGMAALQAEVVHQGVHYDLVVDSTDATPQACAQAVAARLRAEAAPARQG